MKKTEIKPSGEVEQVISFMLGGDEYGVAILSVREIIRVGNITRVPEAPRFVYGITNLRGHVIPVIHLARQLGLDWEIEDFKKARIVVVELGDQTVGILVDEVPGVLRVPAGSVEPTPELIQSRMRKDYIRGVGKLDGRLVILLNLETILFQAEIEELQQITKEE